MRSLATWLRSSAIPVTVLFLLQPQDIHAFPSQNGGSGLFQMRTTETIGDWGAEYYFLGGLDSYESPGQTATDLDIGYAPGVNFGLGERTEIGFHAYHRRNTDQSASVTKEQAHIKYRFAGQPTEDGVNASFTLFGGKYDDSEQLSRDGSFSGGELNLSFFSGLSSAHLLFGYEDWNTKPGAVIDYVNEPKAKAGFGLLFGSSPQTQFSFELLLTESLETHDQNFHFIPGVRFNAGHFEFGMGAALGIPRDRSKPEHSYFVHFAYLTNKTRTTTTTTTAEPNTAAEGVPGTPTKDTQAMEEQFEKLNARLTEQTDILSALERRITTLGPVAPTSSPASVQVVTSRALFEVGRQAEELLQAQGYRVIGTHVTNSDAPDETWVYYRLGYAGEAVKLGNAIPKSQNVKNDQKLPGEVDIRVFVGKDLALTASTTTAVEIVANTDVAVAGSKVAETLRAKGFRIVAIRRGDFPTRSETWIRYRPGRSKAAVDLGRLLLPGDQMVTRDPAIPATIDLRVEVGKDLL